MGNLVSVASRLEPCRLFCRSRCDFGSEAFELGRMLRACPSCKSHTVPDIFETRGCHCPSRFLSHSGELVVVAALQLVQEVRTALLGAEPPKQSRDEPS